MNEFIIVINNAQITAKAEKYIVENGLITLLARKDTNSNFVCVFSVPVEKLDYIMMQDEDGKKQDE